MSGTSHLIGLLLGTEQDWPVAFENIVRRLGTITDGGGTAHTYDVERVTIEPFDLRSKPRHDLVIDRLAYWYYHPREWLKKVALMDDVYLLNSPFTFQSMEKHAAYCAMMRLGLHVPDTVLVPYKNPPDNAKYAFTAAHYNVFARSLSIGAETMVMKFDPDQPMHARYSIAYEFLDAATGEETVTIGRLVNAFFRWEFNSCETLIKDGWVFPIDYANACPDVAITSLHYYFPWAMKALVKWSVFCTATGRLPRYDLDTRHYFDVADRTDLSYVENLSLYQHLADDYFDVERYHDFCASRLAHLDEVVLDWIESADFDRLLVDTVRSTFPQHEHDQFIAHYRGLLGAWASDERGGP